MRGESGRVEKIEAYLTKRARRKTTEAYLVRVMGGLVRGVIDSALEERIREKMKTEDGIASMTHADWHFMDRMGLVTLREGVK